MRFITLTWMAISVVLFSAPASAAEIENVFSDAGGTSQFPTDTFSWAQDGYTVTVDTSFQPQGKIPEGRYVGCAVIKGPPNPRGAWGGWGIYNVDPAKKRNDPDRIVSRDYAGYAGGVLHLWANTPAGVQIKCEIEWERAADSTAQNSSIILTSTEGQWKEFSIPFDHFSPPLDAERLARVRGMARFTVTDVVPGTQFWIDDVRWVKRGPS